MKIKIGFALRKFAGKWMAVSVGENADEKNLFITLNDTGAFVWNLLNEDITYCDVIKAITTKYDIDEQTAKADFDEFLEKVKKAGIIDE